jgi:periodic tryptophan protein 2
VFGEGLRDYSLDDDMISYPIYLTEAITLAAVETRLAVGDFEIALQMTIHLNDYALIKQGNVGKYSV